MVKIRFTINGEKRSVNVEPNDILLNVIRDQLGIKSPKCGCERGDCGSCSILINGKSARSCLILAIEVDGMELTTIEGLGKDKLTELQEYFISYNAFQCGYCAPGMIISATELIRKNPHPSKSEIKEALAGNLCRCTGYIPVLEAVHDATHREES